MKWARNGLYCGGAPGIEAALGDRAENPAAADAENAADEAMNPEVGAEVELAMASAREQIISNGGELSLGEVRQLPRKRSLTCPWRTFSVWRPRFLPVSLVLREQQFERRFARRWPGGCEDRPESQGSDG